MEQSAVSVDILDDEIFKSYGKEFKEKEKERGSSFAPREYEDLAFVGTDLGINCIVRLLGAPVGIEQQVTNYVRKPSDPVEFIASKVKDKDGKQFNLRWPVRNKENMHILHRLYDKVCDVEWVKDPVTGKSRKVFKYETKHPELFEAVTKTGYSQDDAMGYKCAKGLKGQQVVAYNVIDRGDNYCNEKKECKILVKNVNVTDKGAVFADEGVPSYGFVGKLTDVYTKFGNYENYDVAIYRTGQKEDSYHVFNASYKKEKDSLEELDPNTDGSVVDPNLIVTGPLTQEEKTYKRHDLLKLKAPSTYQKIEKRLGWIFKLCDACLGTKFEDELANLVKDEKARFKELYGDNKSAEAEAKAETVQATAETAAVQKAMQEQEVMKRPTQRQAVGEVTGLTSDKIALLKGWSKLTQEQRDLIEDVKDNEGTLELVFKGQNGTMVGDKQLCQCECGALAPIDFSSCPMCGADFLD
jgi:hypothetical protein